MRCPLAWAHCELGGAGRDRERQQQLIGEVKLDGGCGSVMLTHRANHLVGDCFGRPSQPAIGGKARFQGRIIGEQKDAGAGTGRGDPLRLNVDCNAQIIQGCARPIRHALRNVRGQICRDRPAGDPPQRAALQRVQGIRPGGSLIIAVKRPAMVQTISPPPTGYHPQRFNSASTQSPIMCKAGRYA